jgi:hypothetical protein
MARAAELAVEGDGFERFPEEDSGEPGTIHYYEHNAHR